MVTGEREHRVIDRAAVTAPDSPLSTIQGVAWPHIYNMPDPVVFSLTTGHNVPDAISFDSRAPLVDISLTLTAQRYVDDILLLIVYRSFCDNLHLLLNTIIPCCTWNVLLYTSLASYIAWSLSHRAHLGRYKKVIATISKYWRFSPTHGDNLAQNSLEFSSSK